MTLEFKLPQSVALDEIEQISEDNTIGLLQRLGGEMRGQAMFDIHRIRQALITYDIEFGEDTVELSLVKFKSDPDKPPLLALVPRNGAERAVVLAPRTSPDWEPPEEPLGNDHD